MTTCIDEQVMIPVEGGRLVGRLTYPSDGCPQLAALIIGPHPLLGGSPDNPVISSLRAGLSERGAAVLTFDYRDPIGNTDDPLTWSEMVTEFWRTNHVPQEHLWRLDVTAAVDHLRAAAPGPMVLAGYSFGCRGVADEAAHCGAAATVCISPNPVEHDMSGLRASVAPLLVISSDNDFSCPTADLHSWFADLPEPKAHHCLAGAEHFFRGREAELTGLVVRFLESCGRLRN